MSKILMTSKFFCKELVIDNYSALHFTLKADPEGITVSATERDKRRVWLI